MEIACSGLLDLNTVANTIKSKVIQGNYTFSRESSKEIQISRQSCEKSPQKSCSNPSSIPNFLRSYEMRKHIVAYIWEGSHDREMIKTGPASHMVRLLC